MGPASFQLAGGVDAGWSTLRCCSVNGVLGRLPSGPPVDVGVLAYRGDGVAVLESLLPETTLAAPFVSSDRLVKARPRPHVMASPSGTASPAAAIAGCADVLRNWLALHPCSPPPLVVHVTNGNDRDDLGRILSSLKALSTARGNVALMSCLLTSSGEGIPSPSALGQLADESARSHWEWSNKTSNGQRLLSVNELPADAIIWALAQLARGDRRTILKSADRPDAKPRFESHLLWAPKAGNTDDEWEDGTAVDPERGRVAVTDGAGSGIFSRRWADIVARAAVNDPPPIPGSALAEWLQGCRERWLKELNLPELRYTQRRKVETVGTGATLLTLNVRPSTARRLFAGRQPSVGDSSPLLDLRRRATPRAPRSPFCMRTTLGYAVCWLQTSSRKSGCSAAPGTRTG